MADTDSADSNLGEAENDSNNVNSNAQSNGNDDIEITGEVNTPRKKRNITKRKPSKPAAKSKRSTNPRRRNKNANLNKSSEIICLSGSSDEEGAEEVEVQVEIERVPLADAEAEPEIQLEAEIQRIPEAAINREPNAVTEMELDDDAAPEVVAIPDEDAPISPSDVYAAINRNSSPLNPEEDDVESNSSDDLDQDRYYQINDGFTGFIDLRLPDGEEILKDISEVEEIEIIQMQVLTENGRGFDSPPRKRRRIHEEFDDSSEFSSSPSFTLSSPISYARRSRTGSPASRGSRKSNIDLTHPKYLVPFEYGWKREVVTRGITSREDGISKDVYYFHPGGKKLRSLREVSEKLTAGLTPENFTFYKEPLGIEPRFEIVRNARSLGHSPSTSSAPSATPVRRAPAYRAPSRSYSHPSTSPRHSRASEPRTGRRRYQKATRETASSPFLVPPPARRSKIVLRFNKGTPKIALKKPSTAVNGNRASAAAQKVEGPKPHPDAPAGPRRKITPRKRFPKAPVFVDDTEMDIGASASSYDTLTWSRFDEKSTIQEGEQDYCTIRCANAVGLIPTLQCSICLCIYHPDCCDMDHITSVFAPVTYICENCQAKSTDLSERGLVKNISPERVTCEKSPPIISPKPIHPLAVAPITPSAPSAPSAPTIPSIPSAPSTALVPLGSRLPQLRPRPPSSSSAGGVTPWFPPTRRVFKSPSIPASMFHRPEGSSSPPQSIINLNYKRYIVVPKHRVLPFAPPNQNTSPTKPEYNPSATTIIMPTPTATIIEGPPLKSNPFMRTTGAGSGVLLFPFTMGENPDAGSSSQYFFNPIAGSSATQRSLQPDLPIGSGTLDHFAKIRDKGSKRTTEGVDESMQKFMRNICIGYTALLNVFQYLKVQELLRAGRVCRLWRDIAGHPSLWRTVRMKNSQVSDWKGFTDSLIRHETKFLDLRKMLVSLDETEEMWGKFSTYIANVKSLEGLEMCRCSVEVIEQIIESCPQLHVFNAQMIGMREQTGYQKLKIQTLTQMTSLKEIRLKSCFGLNLAGSLGDFAPLKETLTVFSMTSIRNLSEVDVYQIGKLENLETLELGECTELPHDFPAAVIAKLKKLKRVRFEKGPSHWTANEMLYEMQKLKDLVQLELINFDIRPGFDDALAACTNIRKLLLIPTYVTQSATTNNIVLSGAFRLWDTLTHFIWVVTMELLKVTELFVDQCDARPQLKGGNSVPVLKPVPISELNAEGAIAAKRAEENIPSSKNSTPITVIPMDELHDMVKNALPNTRVKLLKIPFQNTWRQSFVEGSV